MLIGAGWRGGWGKGQNIEMPRSGDAEEGLLAPAQPSERCGPKAKKTSLAAVAVATIVVAAVVFIEFVDHSDSTPAETPEVPEVPDTPDDPDTGLERFHCEAAGGGQICKGTQLTGAGTFLANDCNNTCTSQPQPAPVDAKSLLHDFPCMGGTCSGSGICCDKSSAGPCCPDPNGVCCPAGCCPAGHSCCGENHCAPAGSTCCDDGYCLAGTTCCAGGGCCPAAAPKCMGGNKCGREGSEDSEDSLDAIFVQHVGVPPLP